MLLWTMTINVFAATELTRITGFQLLKGGATIHNGETVSLEDALTAKYYYSFSSDLLEDIVQNSKYDAANAFDLQVPDTLRITEVDGTTVAVRATVIVEDGPTYSNFILGYLYFSGGKAQYYFNQTTALQQLTTIHQVDIDNVELAFTCKIDDSGLAENDKSLVISSPSGGSDITVDVKERQDVAPQIKSKNGTYQSQSRSILWTVETNTGNPILAGLKFVDVLDTNQVYTAGTFKVNGTIVDSATIEFNQTTRTLTYTPATSPSANTDLVFTYETDVTSLFINGENLQDASRDVTNLAKWQYNEGVSDGKIGKVTVQAKWQEKEAIDVDLDAGIITWKIIINSNGSGASNVIVYDEMDSNLSYIADSMQVIGNTVTEANITAGTFTYGTKSDYHGMSFPLNAALTQDVTIIYKTKIASSYLDTQNEEASLSNRAWLSFSWNPYGDGTSTYYSTGVGIGTSVPTSLIKKDYKSYDDVEKTITWSITVNANRVELKNVVVTDIVPTGQTYKQGSAKVISRNSSAVSTNDYFVETYHASNPTFAIGSSLGDLGTDTVTFEIKTIITDTNFIQYNVNNYNFTNKAQLDANYVSTGSPTSKDTIATTNLNNEVLRKISNAYNYGTQIFQWEIIFNKNHAPMENVSIVDIIPSNQIFREDSGVTITRIAGAQDSSTLATGYTFNSGNLTVSIGDSIDTIYDTYSITYYTTLNPDDPTLNLKDNSGGSTRRINNEAELNRDTFNEVSAQANRDIQNVLMSKNAGSINTADGNVTFTININQNKTTLSDNQITDVLPDGLLIDIYSIKLFEATVNSSGTFIQSLQVASSDFSKQYDAATRTLTVTLPTPSNKTYQLVYVADIISASGSLTNSASLGNEDTDSAAASNVTLDRAAAAGASGNAKAKKGKTTIKVVDLIESTLTIPNSTYGLYDIEGNLIQEKQTDSSGLLVFENLTLNAEYIIKETTPGQHYIPDSTVTFPIRVINTTTVEYDGQNYTTNLPAVQKVRSHDWTVEFNTTNQYGYPLQNVLFGLFDQDGNEMKQFSSDANGLVSFTAPFGDYEVRQLGVPSDCDDGGDVFNLSINSTDSVSNIVRVTNSGTQVNSHALTQNNPIGQFLTGDIHQIASKKNLTLEVEKDLQLLDDVMVNGTSLAPGQYTISNNQIILSATFLSSLQVDEYELSLQFIDGTSLQINFFVHPKPATANTGYGSYTTLWVTLVLLGGLGITRLHKKKEDD